VGDRQRDVGPENRALRYETCEAGLKAGLSLRIRYRPIRFSSWPSTNACSIARRRPSVAAVSPRQTPSRTFPGRPIRLTYPTTRTPFRRRRPVRVRPSRRPSAQPVELTTAGAPVRSDATQASDRRLVLDS
jgi:hypothetical protein